MSLAYCWTFSLSAITSIRISCCISFLPASIWFANCAAVWLFASVFPDIPPPFFSHPVYMSDTLYILKARLAQAHTKTQTALFASAVNCRLPD
jgi:hypothetical protein